MAKGGAKTWYFPDGYLPEKVGPKGPMEAHEALMLFNVRKKSAKVKLDFYFSDREPVLGVPIALPGERVIGIRLDHPDEIGGVKIPPLTQYAVRVRSNVTIVAMMGRVDTTQNNLAYYSSDGFCE